MLSITLLGTISLLNGALDESDPFLFFFFEQVHIIIIGEWRGNSFIAFS